MTMMVLVMFALLFVCNVAFILYHVLPAFIWEHRLRCGHRRSFRHMPLAQRVRHKLEDFQLRGLPMPRECS